MNDEAQELLDCGEWDLDIYLLTRKRKKKRNRNYSEGELKEDGTETEDRESPYVLW